MTRAKLDKIIAELAACRNRGGVRASELEQLAKDLGRVQSKRGKEPTWVSAVFADLRPLSIPHHGTELNKFTARSIIDLLGMDVDRWEEQLDIFGGK